MNPAPLRGSLVALLLGAGYRQTVGRTIMEDPSMDTFWTFLGFEDPS